MNNIYYSGFSEDIVGLAKQKQTLGYKYKSQAMMLKRFDQFCLKNYPNATVLDKEIVLHWVAVNPGEHPSTQETRLSSLNELARYIIRKGELAYILPKGMLAKKVKFTPYIFSDEEIKHLFAAIDNGCPFCYEVPLRHIVMPVFFRLLYCCGLRVTEARLLKVEDVDLERGVLTLTRTKLGKCRQIPLSLELLNHFKEYSQKVHVCSTPQAWFFPGLKNNPMTSRNINRNLRRFLWKAGISHHGRTKVGERGAPCVHSLRHTFAVNCLRKWMREGKNPNAYLPILQAYMGHACYRDTAYYLHLSYDLVQDIRSNLEQTLGAIIPFNSSQNTISHEKYD
jgi:integrase